MNCRTPDASGTGRKEWVEGRAVRSGGGAVIAERTKFVYSGLQIDPQLQIHTLVHTTPRSCSPPPLFLVERGSVMLCLWPIRVVPVEISPAVWFIQSQHGQARLTSKQHTELGPGNATAVAEPGVDGDDRSQIRVSSKLFHLCFSTFRKSSRGAVTLKCVS